MSEQAIELKGAGFTLSVLHILTQDLNSIEQQLTEKLSQMPQFFNMAPVVIQLQEGLTSLPFEELKALLLKLNLVPVGVVGIGPENKDAIHRAGLAYLTSPKKATSSNAEETEAKAAVTQTVTVEKTITVTEPVPSKVVRQNLRSGQQIYAKDCDLIVLGSVSNGAEIIADGNIHVYGALRGRAIAGASGRNDVVIISRKLQAELVSINGHYWTSDQLQENWEKSVCISLAGEKLHVSPLEN